MIFSNLFIFGQDWIMFTGVRDGVFQFVSNFRETEVLVRKGMIVPQAWTLGVELSFYLLAPFVLVRPMWIFILLGTSLLLRGYLLYIGLGFQVPWTYRFFPTELALFLLGALSHQLWKPYVEKAGFLTTGHTGFVTFFMLLYCSVYFLLPKSILHQCLVIALFLMALPFLFAFQRRSQWDEAIGELSYPIYISHLLVIWVVNFAMTPALGAGWQSPVKTGTVVVATGLMSLLLNKFVGEYVNRLRSSVKKRQIQNRPG